MIVCAIDDLIFSIKISTAAKQLGVDVYFERMRDRVLPTVREKQPSLVIFDLNSSRLEPMAVIAAMKADPQLSGVKILGYVSHADSDAIAAARKAGIDQVLARSAFTAQLGTILESA
jgi:CheY-like chemotaxis protein